MYNNAYIAISRSKVKIQAAKGEGWEIKKSCDTSFSTFMLVPTWNLSLLFDYIADPFLSPPATYWAEKISTK